MNYDGRKFRVEQASGSSQTTGDTLFTYHQTGPVLTGTYHGGGIQTGQLIGLVSDKGQIDMRYQHIDAAGVLRTGQCHSRPEYGPDGHLRLYEEWEWTDAAHHKKNRAPSEETRGQSVLIEVSA